MNENAKKWVAALRSGKYRQARGRLRIGDGFCCLGVACDLYGKEYGVEWKKGRYEHDVFLDQTAILPDLVTEWLGLARSDGSMADYIFGPSLTQLNDSGRTTFKRLANFIESEADNLFRETINDFSDRLLPERESDVPAVSSVGDHETVG